MVRSSLPLSIHQFSPKTKEEEEKERSIYQSWRDLYSPFAVGKTWTTPLYRNNEELWYGSMASMVGTMAAQQHFVARPSDLIVASFPKSGTTWIKALLFATMGRHGRLHGQDNPLTSLNPHQCVPFLEMQVYSEDKIPDLSSMPSPRLFSTHIPFVSLPKSVVESRCRMVYLWREPKATFVSMWHFANNNRAMWSVDETLSLEEAFDMFCEGVCFYGPYWDHVLGYWKASGGGDDDDNYSCSNNKKNNHDNNDHNNNNNNNVLFLKYEDLMQDPRSQLKRLGEFVGMEFTDEEENEGVLDDIISLCSFKNLRDSEANKTGKVKLGERFYGNNVFFRQGEVGDWVNYLTPEMAEKLDQITTDRFSSFGLTF